MLPAGWNRSHQPAVARVLRRPKRPPQQHLLRTQPKQPSGRTQIGRGHRRYMFTQRALPKRIRQRFGEPHNILSEIILHVAGMGQREMPDNVWRIRTSLFYSLEKSGLVIGNLTYPIFTSQCRSFANLDIILITIQGTGFKDMTPCDGTSTSERWCCGSNTNDCCSPDSRLPVVILARNFLDAAPTTVTGSMQPSSPSKSNPSSSSPSASKTSNPSSSSPSSSSSPAESQPGQPTTSSPPSSPQQENSPTSSNSTQAPQDSQSLSTGAKVGIAIGALIGGAALVGIGAWLALASQRRRKSSTDKNSAIPSELDTYVADRKHAYRLEERPVHEVGGWNGNGGVTSVEMGHMGHQTGWDSRGGGAVMMGELPAPGVASELEGSEGSRVKGVHY